MFAVKSKAMQWYFWLPVHMEICKDDHIFLHKMTWYEALALHLRFVRQNCCFSLPALVLWDLKQEFMIFKKSKNLVNTLLLQTITLKWRQVWKKILLFCFSPRISGLWRTWDLGGINQGESKQRHTQTWTQLPVAYWAFLGHMSVADLLTCQPHNEAMNADLLHTCPAEGWQRHTHRKRDQTWPS